MDIEKDMREKNEIAAKALGGIVAAAKVGGQYIIAFPGNMLRSRKELKESGEEYKFSDVLLNAHDATAENIDFDKEHKNFSNKILGFINKRDKEQKQLMQAQGIDEQQIITGIKYFSNQIRFSRVGQTFENSLRALAQKVNDKLEQIAEGDSKTNSSKFVEDLRKDAPSYEEQKEFADRVVQKIEQESTSLELSKDDDNIK